MIRSGLDRGGDLSAETLWTGHSDPPTEREQMSGEMEEGRGCWSTAQRCSVWVVGTERGGMCTSAPSHEACSLLGCDWDQSAASPRRKAAAEAPAAACELVGSGDREPIQPSASGFSLRHVSTCFLGILLKMQVLTHWIWGGT